MKEVDLYAHVASSIACTQPARHGRQIFCYLGNYSQPKQVSSKPLDSTSTIDLTKLRSFTSCLICGPSKIQAFNFPVLNSGNLCERKLKH